MPSKYKMEMQLAGPLSVCFNSNGLKVKIISSMCYLGNHELVDNINCDNCLSYTLSIKCVKGETKTRFSKNEEISNSFNRL